MSGSRPLLVFITAVALSAACENAVGTECLVTTDCGVEALCVDGRCLDDPRRALLPNTNEGEGEGGGEGQPGEGEGEGQVGEGEGEGQIGEGEGEGQTGEGEGEGQTGEGEGEGADPCDACSALQECVNQQCEYVGVVCDAFGSATIDYFDDLTTTFNASTALYEVGFTNQGGTPLSPQERPVQNRRLLTSSFPASAIRVRFTMESTDVDPVLAIYQTGGGACTEFRSNDDRAAGDVNSEVEVGVGVNVSVQVLMSSFESQGEGQVTLRTRPVLCGKTTNSKSTFDQCVGRYPQDQNCETNNLCVRDASNRFTGEFCCVRDGCTGAGPIILLPDENTCPPGGGG